MAFDLVERFANRNKPSAPKQIEPETGSTVHD
jgi:hypothetical protein